MVVVAGVTIGPDGVRAGKKFHSWSEIGAIHESNGYIKIYSTSNKIFPWLTLHVTMQPEARLLQLVIEEMTAED